VDARLSEAADAGATTFVETQHYASTWLVVVLAALALIGVGLAVGAVTTGASDGEADLIAGLVAGVVLCVCLPLALAASRLVTEVTARGVRARMAPFQSRGRRYTWSEVEGFGAVTYRPLREFGGWGIRGTRRHGAYNARGDRGVRLELTDGSTFLIGSQEPERLEAAIAAATGRPPRLTGLVPADKELQ
jgi:hypothetical protein